MHPLIWKKNIPANFLFWYFPYFFLSCYHLHAGLSRDIHLHPVWCVHVNDQWISDLCLCLAAAIEVRFKVTSLHKQTWGRVFIDTYQMPIIYWLFWWKKLDHSWTGEREWSIKNNFCGMRGRHGRSIVGCKERNLDFQQWLVNELRHETRARLAGPAICRVPLTTLSRILWRSKFIST